MDTKKFFAELQRRNVYKAAVAYGVVGWLLVQIATQVFPFFDVPAWVIRFIVLLLLLGFPIAVFLAWVFELTPEGLKRTEEVAPGRSVTRSTGRKLDFIIIGVLLAVIGVMAFQRSGPVPRLPEKSIAVLPFADLSAAHADRDVAPALSSGCRPGLVTRSEADVFANRNAATSHSTRSGEAAYVVSDDRFLPLV